MQSVTDSDTPDSEYKPVPALPPEIWSSHFCPGRGYFLILPMRDAGDLFALPIQKSEQRDRNKENPRIITGRRFLSF